jgi:Nucleotidyl transferase AbiEii toxin, Type IV TA system
MTTEPRTQHEYGAREIAAARRVLVDLGQVLGSWFEGSIVVVGGWVPELLLGQAEEPHIGSIDVDLALDAEKLGDGRYAEIVKLLLDTGRYEKTDQPFRLRATVDLSDGNQSVVVDVDFLKPAAKRHRRKGPPLLPDFRPLDADGCAAAFLHPESVAMEGPMISGAENRVHLRVASVADFLVMKSYALAGRDKPKDAYDICFCLDNSPGGIEALARAWRERRDDPLLAVALTHLRDKFRTVDSYGPRQVAIFYDPTTREEQERHSRRGYELVARFLELIGRA